MSGKEKICPITDTSFDKEILKSKKPVLIDFWAEWCGPCRALTPIIEELAEKYDGKVKFAKINVDENPQTPAKYGVRGIPTIMLFKEGEVIGNIVGFVPKSKLESLIKKCI